MLIEENELIEIGKLKAGDQYLPLTNNLTSLRSQIVEYKQMGIDESLETRTLETGFVFPQKKCVFFLI